MTLNLYSIKDKLTDFQGVLVIQDDDIANRIFEGYCRKQKAENYTDPKYFELYQIGTMDSKTGVITGFSKQEIRLVKEGEQFDE